jgi:hypothetical protein
LEVFVHSSLRILAVGGLAFLAACGREATSPADVSLDRDVALFTADAAGQDIEFMRGPGGRFGMGLPAGPGNFECDDVSPPGLTVTRTCEFYDVDGKPMDAYEAGVTNRVVVHVEMDGAIDRGDWSGTVSRVRDFEVTGLADDDGLATWNGTGSGTMSRVRQTSDGGEVQMDMTSTQTVEDVVIPVPRTEDGWPLGGTITSSVSITFTGGPRDGETVTRDVTIEFDGTQYATVTVNGETFTIDMADRCHAEGRHEGPGPWGRGPRHGGHR